MRTAAGMVPSTSIACLQEAMSFEEGCCVMYERMHISRNTPLLEILPPCKCARFLLGTPYDVKCILVWSANPLVPQHKR